MPTIEKKIFAFNGVNYTIICGRRWYVEWYDQVSDGVTVRRRLYGQINRIKDLAEREARAIELVRALSKSNSNSVLLETLDNYKSLYRRKTYLGFNTIIKKFLEWIAPVSDQDVTPEIANNFLMHLSTTTHPTTIVNYRLSLSTIYNRWDKQLNPFKDLKTRPRQSRSLMYFNSYQIELLRGYLSVHNPPVWLAAQILFYTFVRPGEQRFLKIQDFNLEDGFIEIPAQVSKNRKTQKVIIPAQLLETLKGTGLFTGANYNKYLFGNTGFASAEPVSTNYFNRHHSEALKALKITGRYAFYSWKHTGVVKAVKAGINIKDLQMQLRHHSLDMVNEYLKNLGVMDSDDLRYRFPTM